jgi:hypothetical protein
MKLRCLCLAPIAVFLATILSACGGASSETGPASGELVNPSKWPISNSKCWGWFGGGVAVAMCKEGAAQPFEIGLEQPEARYGSATGIAQAMGTPLRDGDQFQVSATPANTELLVRIEIRSGERLGTALFRLPEGAERAARIKISVVRRQVTSKIDLDPGPSISAETVYVPRIRPEGRHP